MAKRYKKVLPALTAALLLPALCVGAFAAESGQLQQTPELVTQQNLTSEAASYSCEAEPVTIDQDFAFEEDARYVIVSAGSANPTSFAMSGQLKDGLHVYAKEISYDEETQTLSLKDTGADIRDYIWEAKDADGVVTYLQNLQTGKRFQFSQSSISMGDLGTSVSAGLDGRIYLGANTGYDYYLVCRYFGYASPQDYYFSAAIASSTTDASGMPMTIYKVTTCTHPEDALTSVGQTDPTCTEDGYDEYLCAKCGETIKRNIVPASGHHFINGVCTVCGLKDEWDGTSVTPWLNGNGTESSPYLIENEEMLAYLAAKVNAGEKYANTYFEVTKDLDLGNHEWTAISNTTTATSFAGIFDGGGHTIKNLYIKNTTMPALFGTVGAAASQHSEIKNLTLKGINDSDKGYAAGLIAFAGNVTVTNVGNEVDVNGRYAAGGLIGYHYNLTATIVNSYNKGTITASERQRTSRTGEGTGGLIGQSNGTLIVKNSYNLGDVTIGSAQYGNAGGIAGAVKSMTAEGTYNYGVVSGGYTAGAIVGYGTVSSGDRLYYLQGCAPAVNGSSGGIGNAKAYTNNQTLLKNLGSPFVSGTVINEDYSGSPALNWEADHKHTINEENLSKAVWNWSDDLSSSAVTFVCSGEDCYGTDNGDGTHTVTAYAEVTQSYEPETCDTDGQRIYTASLKISDALTLSDTKTVPAPASGHRMRQVAYKAPTYRASGNKEYYYCNVCKHYYADEAGTKQIEEFSWIIPKLTTVYGAGDVTRDGFVDSADAALLLRYLAGKIVLDDEQVYLSDRNGDGKESVDDVTEIRLHSLKGEE